jgi:hypothetical protein
MHIHPDIFGAGHKGRSFLKWVRADTPNLLQQGRPFILRRVTGDVK